MKLPQSGGCRCGKIHYEITEVRSWSTRATAPIDNASRAAPSPWAGRGEDRLSSQRNPAATVRTADIGRVNTR